MPTTSVFLGFVAGVLSILSPCVLPLLPLVLGAAVSEHKWGPGALAAGLALSFVAIGLFIATIGFALGLDANVFRGAAALLLLLAGVVLVVPTLHTRLAAAGGPVSNWADRRLSGFSTRGLSGQFALGLLLGAVWSPCVGPTLGTASVLASQGKGLLQVSVIMIAFGLGAALPLILLGSFSRERLARRRDQLRRAGKGGQMVLGVLLLVAGLFILTGADKQLETFLVEHSPQWLIVLTTQF
ncbi:MAG: cytochrome c biogenesis protein CcdA [Mesorhizobium sp.]|nr:MAG: cytochrome c biogenesis protein CcdA [Mesorhizobium sp.]TJV69753.1 MAG: cytochrome c biogenesis protein CcdA [Mesorhizobium sp.]